MDQNKAILIVTYNLKGPSAQYSSLYEYLKNHEHWWHYLPYTWLIVTRETPREVFEEMKLLVQEGDHFLIVRWGSGYWGRLPKKALEWIRKHA